MSVGKHLKEHIILGTDTNTRNVAAAQTSPICYAAGEGRIGEDFYYDLDIPTSVSANNEVAHPSVLFIPEKFNGYMYWMAITPLPIALGGDYEAYENPEIFASNDRHNWVVPTGLTNPIAADPGGATDHNADTCLFLSADRKTMYCAWTELSGGGTAEKVVVKSTSDGVNWSSAVTLLSVAPASERVLTPQLNWDPENDVWVLHTVDTVPANNTLKYCTRADLDGTFGSRTSCTYTLPDSETDVWHVDIRRLDSGRWIGVLGTDASGGDHQQYLMHSDDAGASWEFGTKLSERLGYKSALVPIDSRLALLYWGLRGGPNWHVELVPVWFDKSVAGSVQAIFESGAANGAANKIGRYYMEDSFARADEAPIATADSGESWTATAGQFDVVSNQMDANASGNNIATIDTGFSDAEIVVDYGTVTATFTYVVVRLSTSAQFHRIGIASSTLKFQRVGGAGTADIRSVSIDSVSSGKVRVVCRGNTYSLYFNDTFMFKVTDTDHASNTKFGVQASETGTKIDRVIISRL